MTKKMTKTNRRNINFLTFCIIIAALIMLSFSSDTINFVFLSVMCILLIVAYFGGLRKMKIMAKSFNNASQKIEGFYEMNHQNAWEHYSTANDLFENNELDSLFVSYCKEMFRIKTKEKDISCDIEDYINVDAVMDKCANGYLSQISGIMTGLGILGTFLGLAIGLKGFDSTSAETMAASIPPLIDGIKIAFYTSIFGVTFSILFNLLLGETVNYLETTIEGFLNCFEQYVVPNSNNDAMRQILECQKEEVAAIKQLAEEVSVKIAESIRETTIPVFNDINETMKMFSENMVNGQSSGIKEAATNFVEAVNDSLNGEFEQLSKTIRDVCEWQKSMMVDMQGVLDEIRASGENMTAVNQAVEAIVEKTNDYIMTLADFQDDVDAAYVKLEEQKDIFSKVLDEVKTVETEIGNNLIQNAETINRLSDEILAKIKTGNDIDSMITSELKTNADALMSASNAFNKDVQSGISTTFKLFDNNLSDIALKLSGTILEVKEMTEDIPKTMYSYSEKLNNEYQKYVSSITESQKEMERVIREAIRKNEERAN